jgi:DNA-binding transcriptional MerR regulator
MDDGLMTIGAFSRATLLSIKALRAYHEGGILVPARVDPRTGYRAYHVAQLPDAVVIRRLRALDVPLAQVHEIVSARDPEVTRQVLKQHAETMHDRLDEVRRIVVELQETVDTPAVHTPVHVDDVPASHTLSYPGRVRHQGIPGLLERAYAALGVLAERDDVAVTGPPGALYPPAIVDDEVEDDVVAYLPVAAPVMLGEGDAPVAVGELPAARVAVAVHTGPYETIDDSYRQLGAWVALHARTAELPVREVYVVSYGETDDPSRFRTEIQWPILDQE